MKAIMIMYDSLRRDLLESSGCDWTITPNFKRLAKKCVQFDQCYVGSMPCMPAKREIHTGRANFLHRSWGPMEPYDDSMPEILRNHEVMLKYKPYHRMLSQEHINRMYMQKEEQTSQAVTFRCGLDFIEKNHEEDNWFLQIETFDPHEPFYSLKEDKALYPHTFAGDGLEADWPPYAKAEEDEETFLPVWSIRIY